MAESIIWYFSTLGSAALFFFIGVYAEKREKPMWFWSGTEVKASEITNVRQYNKENGLMWKRFSIWFWLAGAAEIWSSLIALILLISGCTAGIVMLVLRYKKIESKYRRK